MRLAGIALAGGAALFAVAGLAGCSKFSKKEGPSKYVYVTAKEATLRDRVAAVSNRMGTVQNGDKLTVLEHARRFIKVRTPDGKVGWLEEKLTADQSVRDEFDGLRDKHKDDAVIAKAVTRDEAVLHVAPGRETEKFFRLQEGEAVSLLVRAMVAKPLPPGTVAAPVAAATPAGGKDAAPAAPAGPVMEDWWLVRTSKGEVGWIYSHLIDVSEPDALSRYSEGQRIVGAYVIANVEDPESGMVNAGQTVTSIPEYVTVLSPYKAGLPYDFDQVRVFTWNRNKHRYETAFREKNIEGYLPVVVTHGKDPYGKNALAGQDLPIFKYRVLAADAPAPAPDPQTGIVTPGKTVEKVYRLEETTVHRILQPGTQAPEVAHPVAEVKKEKKGKKKK
jgi:SH3-like domain-containing protein